MLSGLGRSVQSHSTIISKWSWDVGSPGHHKRLSVLSGVRHQGSSGSVAGVAGVAGVALYHLWVAI